MSCPHKKKTNFPKPESREGWWPNQLSLTLIQQDINSRNNPSTDFNYIHEIETLDIVELKNDIRKVLTTSKDWWPADYGHYGPFMIRLAWHSAGTYRIMDGRGGGSSGTQRFAPLNSWPDNANLDKGRRILWDIKKKYGRKVSWGDLMILAGNVALEDMGFETFGFAFGRVDVYAPEDDVYWGPEETWLAAERTQQKDDKSNELEAPLGAVQMGLIYVNPEGPNGNPDPLLAAKDIRETFQRMNMNDEETVALIAGGHTFGKAHGAASPQKYVGKEPEGAGLEEQGLGWSSTFKSGKGIDTITSGLEGAWTTNPIKWDNGYFSNLFDYEWKKVESPAGATQWIPTTTPTRNVNVPDAYDKNKSHLPIMFTTDLALRYDPIYYIISKRFYDHPEKFRIAFAKAWYKLTHRDMGPISRCYGPDVPKPQIWQDPVPYMKHVLVDAFDLKTFKQTILKSGLTISQLVRTAWASASTYRCTDHRGGANGARISLKPQNTWHVNNPNNNNELSEVLSTLHKIKDDFNNIHELRNYDGKCISLADLIVIGGSAAIEKAVLNAGFQNVVVPTSLGRTDASQEQTDIESFQYLEPKVDAFRNYISPDYSGPYSSEYMLLDRAYMLQLTPPEMTVLIAGMRVLNANTYTNNDSSLGVLTHHPECLTNDFFIHLLDMDIVWKKQSANGDYYVGTCRKTNQVKWKASSVDLLFGSHSELRAISEYYGCNDSKEIFVRDFVKTWVKVMELDRFDSRRNSGDDGISVTKSIRAKL